VVTAVVEFNAVSKTFRKHRIDVPALSSISLNVAEGEVFGFVGPNGAGKSTTIKIMLDVISDYDGEVRISGFNARDASARKGVAYVPESPAVYEQFTPLEVLRMGLDMYGIRRSDADAWCLSWMEKFSIGHAAKRRIRELSKGTVQRVALAHAMVVSPRLLVLDEPLSGLDPVGRKDVVDILSEYKQQGGAIFFTSHVLHDVERIADRFGFINRGELVTTRSPQSLVNESAGHLIVRFQCAAEAGFGGRLVRDGEYELTLEQIALPEWLARLNAGGGRLLTVKPEMSLERVFFHILDKADSKHAAVV
jgi:ABC-2 type transport system ATP-binding protein